MEVNDWRRREMKVSWRRNKVLTKLEGKHFPLVEVGRSRRTLGPGLKIG